MATTIKASEVRDTLGRHMLTDGFDLVFDLERSTPTRVVDAVTGRSYVNLFSHFASAPLGTNHPAVLSDDAQRRLAEAATNNPANSDMYTAAMAEFVATFSRVGIPDALPHLFLVAGGALAVENALKAAFDWKVRKNLAAGRGELGSKVIHFRQAFHGRSGYTMSLTDSFDPRKTLYYPKFDWPRVSNPWATFPLAGANLEAVIAAEERSVAEIEAAFAASPHDVASIIIEPIQGEGGDNHFRPEFFATLRRLADEHEALLIFDEVQTGVGLTGTFWAYEGLGVVPDIVVFGKKMQVCGILAGRRIDEVEDNVFALSSRINSTWGGNLVDMVRSAIYLGEIERAGLVAHAASEGEYVLGRLRTLQEKHPDTVSNARGRGLMCAFSLASPEMRDKVISALMERDVLMLPSGQRSMRFRPALCIGRADLDEGLGRIEEAITAVS